MAANAWMTLRDDSLWPMPRDRVQSINAVTLLVSDMARSVAFYRTMGFGVAYGGDHAAFTSLRVGDQFLNLMLGDGPGGWGRVILHVSDVDAFHATALAAGYPPEAPPRDAEWGERYFHLTDPDGHELSFAKRL